VLRSLPSIERLLAGEVAERLSAELSRDRVRDLLRHIADEIRVELLEDRRQKSEVGGQKSEAQPSVLSP